MKISVLGTGAYGIALAKVLSNNLNTVSMWTKFQEEIDILNLKRENIKVLKGVKIPNDIKITCNLQECINDSGIIIIAVPTSAVRGVAMELTKYLKSEQIICIASKGLEFETNKFLSQVVYEETKSENICVISGPSFAIELANNAKLGLVVASKLDKMNTTVKLSFENGNICVSEYNDILGVQVCGFTKNVFGIVMGILSGMNMSNSTKATMISILLNDLRLIVQVLGGREQTIYSYAGLGDFLLTCTSNMSRNFVFGECLGKGLCVEDALKSVNSTTIEGIGATKALYKILKQRQIIINSVNILEGILNENVKATDIINCIK